MKNLLFISMYPFPLDTGSKQHAYFILKALVNNFNVYGIFFMPPQNKINQVLESDLLGLGVKAFEICKFRAPCSGNKYSQLFQNIVSFPNAFINYATHSVGLHTINSFIDRYAIDVVHFEHFWFTKYAFNLHHNLKQVVVYHDLHHDIFKQLSKIEKKLHRKLLYLIEFMKFKLYEHQLDKRVFLKIFLNPIEMKSLPKNSVHIPHIVNSDILYRPARDTDFFNILFIGAYSHPPNRRSVKFIITHILPQLVQSRQNFKLHIVGAETDKFAQIVDRSPYRAYIVLHGFKQDINVAFENMDIALFPILNGGGIKTKIIDALASGIPVVTTSKGIEGLDRLPNNCIGIGNTTPEIENEMLKLMNNYPLRLDRSQMGRDFIEKEHSFRAFSKKVTQTYSAL